MKYIFKFLWYLFERMIWLIVGIYLAINLLIERFLKVLAILFIFLWDLKLKKKYTWWNQYHLCFYLIFQFNDIKSYFQLKNYTV